LVVLVGRQRTHSCTILFRYNSCMCSRNLASRGAFVLQCTISQRNYILGRLSLNLSLAIGFLDLFLRLRDGLRWNRFSFIQRNGSEKGSFKFVQSLYVFFCDVTIQFASVFENSQMLTCNVRLRIQTIFLLVHFCQLLLFLWVCCRVIEFLPFLHQCIKFNLHSVLELVELRINPFNSL
jgi:hypothetical protein